MYTHEFITGVHVYTHEFITGVHVYKLAIYMHIERNRNS